ncbi:MAG TPA: phage tail sheath C-terminal domain-containing protein [Candidatus Limnocylindrales bacterium]|nr:phage tail sheath C-terminal domain-containing protein [Candidatus Limnocylindrales bacterium]
MASTLIIPGVQVRTEFAPAPVLPGATGILGIVGITEKGPLDPTPVGSFAEFTQLFGGSSRYTMPELRTAFTNGVSQAYVARVAPGVATPAQATLKDDDGTGIAIVRARGAGLWGNQLAVRVTQIKTLTGLGIKYVNVDVLLGGQVIESHQNLDFDPSSANYFYDKINRNSSAIVVTDAVFGLTLPQNIVPGQAQPLAAAGPAAATASLNAGANAVITATAKVPGEAGNELGVRVRTGKGTLTLNGPGNVPSLVLTSRTSSAADAAATKTTVTNAAGTITIVVTGPTGSGTYGPTAFAKVADIVTAMANDTNVTVVAAAPNAPLPLTAAATSLNAAVDIEVVQSGGDTTAYASKTTLDDIANINDPLVAFAKVQNATALPDAGDDVPLTGGRSNAPALMLTDGTPNAKPLLELLKASADVGDVSVKVTKHQSLATGTDVVDLEVMSGDQVLESFRELTMDPESDNYLPLVLQGSQYLRARDLYVAAHSTSFPAATARTVALTGATSPLVSDYQASLEKLEAAEPVDLVIASVNGQLSDGDAIAVQQAVVAHCTKMADVARTRIGIGSVTASDTASVPKILDHADHVRSDYFVLTAPSGSEAAFAGLLGHQDYFQSPTFKTIAAPDFPPGTYTDAQLTQLITGNVVAINLKHGLGIIVIKGLLTSGRQINVQRTANKAVRDVKAICDVYIGLLNDEGARNALKQQVTAMFLQMQKDGAIVPSTDGTSPAFSVDVHATQDDFAKGIVRVDVAMRPVRAIDYIYCTIFVQN